MEFYLVNAAMGTCISVASSCVWRVLDSIVCTESCSRVDVMEEVSNFSY